MDYVREATKKNIWYYRDRMSVPRGPCSLPVLRECWVRQPKRRSRGCCAGLTGCHVAYTARAVVKRHTARWRSVAYESAGLSLQKSACLNWRPPINRVIRA